KVLWYRNPDWKRHVIIEDQTELDNVCIAAHDIDGDGQIDFAVGAGWLNGKNLGTIQWLSRGKSLDEKWTVHPIAAISWTHRMRFGDVLGTGKAQLTVSPLNATGGKGGVDLTAFSIPQNPKTDPWPRTVLDNSMNRMHNHWHLAGPGGGVATITASQEGVHWLSGPSAVGVRQLINAGATGEKPEQKGAGEIKPGKRSDGGLMLATIEPMHGHMAVVYLVDKPQQVGGVDAKRIVLTEQLKQGHAVYPADFDGDGDDDVVVGWREPGTGEIKGPGLLVFENVSGDGRTWKQHVVDDGGMAAEDIAVGDLDGDGLPEIVAGGRSTKNLKIYRNATAITRKN
ncbi:MAG TPA: FG-GAP-like repeat-containing protein, partial [Caulifigura sp.]|nr:FG-GAP-like repeat-containing protein [Caulifigura sp.]